MHAMKTTTNPRRLVTVPFSKTQCGVDFYINTGRSEEIRGVLTEHPLFRTDFFEFFFLSRARGVLLLGGRRIELHDGMVLLLSPHEQQQWLVDEAELDYTFLIFREDFMRTFLSDKLFVYRLLYCYQSDTPPWFDAPRERFGEYLRLLAKIKTELHPPGHRYAAFASAVHSCRSLLHRYICSPVCYGCGTQNRARWSLWQV